MSAPDRKLRDARAFLLAGGLICILSSLYLLHERSSSSGAGNVSAGGEGTAVAFEAFLAGVPQAFSTQLGRGWGRLEAELGAARQEIEQHKEHQELKDHRRRPLPHLPSRKPTRIS